jgi:hypothetical protein
MPTSAPIVPIGPVDTPPPIANPAFYIPSSSPTAFNMVPYLWPSVVILTYEPTPLDEAPVAAPVRPSSKPTAEPPPVAAPVRPSRAPIAPVSPVAPPVASPTAPVLPPTAPVSQPSRPNSPPAAPVSPPTAPVSPNQPNNPPTVPVPLPTATIPTRPVPTAPAPVQSLSQVVLVPRLRQPLVPGHNLQNPQ